MALDTVPGAMPYSPQPNSSDTTNTNRLKSHDDPLVSPKMHPQTHIYPPPLSPPPEDPMHNICDDLIFSQGTTKWPQEKDRILLAPYDYLDGHPGKDIRSLLIGAFNAWLHVPKPSLDIITKVVGMLHTASLLIDDVEDSSVLRRGVPVAHNIFGTAQTINSANYVYFCALRELMKLNNPQAIEIYNDELLNLHRGQGMDLFWRDSLT
ncbi:geranylgeranyl diphosphate synthase 1, partial [Aureobasidium melanogenum]